MPKCSCGNIFDKPVDTHLYNWENIYCSKDCWKKSATYQIHKTNFSKLYRTLHQAHRGLLDDVIKSMPLDYTDEIYYWIEELKVLYG